jgi:AcrR family transcriptional regulator
MHSRKQSTVEAFIDAGIAAINRDGVDRATVSGITVLANSTRPTFYSYFQDLDGLYAEIWIAHGTAFLERLADPISFDLDDPANRALCEIAVRAHRSAEISEVVEPQVHEWWAELQATGTMQELSVAWRAGNRLGMLLTSPIDPQSSSASILELVLNDKGITEPDAAPKAGSARIPNLSEPHDSDVSVESQLLNSAITVIGNSGVAASSLTRVARHANMTSGTVYPRFSNIHELLIESFHFAMESVTNENFQLISSAGFSPEEFGAFVSAGLTPARHSWRNYRVEVHIAARHDKGLAHSIRDTLHETNARVVKGLSQIPGDEREHQAIAYLVHTIGIGLAILLNLGVPVDKLDHRVLTREVVTVMAGRS